MKNHVIVKKKHKIDYLCTREFTDYKQNHI